VRILLSDGSGLTSRQAATLLSRAGHEVEVLAPTRLGPAGFTRHVRRIHRVPAFGVDPERWLDAALAVLARERFDVLLPTQEQVTILARDAARVRAHGVALPVPSFAALLRVQDKVAQARTLRELGLRHPPTRVVHDRAELLATERLPVYVKTAIGTASTGVVRVADPEALARCAATLAAAEGFRDGVVVQDAAPGPLVMVQAVYAHGRILAWHANTREREGANGGSAVKASVAPAGMAEDLARLGTGLAWHGALSLDAILTPEGPSFIDVNPRLVEPGNAAAAGTELLGALLTGTGAPRAPRPGVRTHQLLIGVLGVAQREGRRRAVARELAHGLLRRGPYAGSREELTPVRRDPVSVVPVLAAATATLLAPSAHRTFTSGAVEAYALTPAAWRRIVAGSVTDARGTPRSRR
jgi:hypothetical protein